MQFRNYNRKENGYVWNGYDEIDTKDINYKLFLDKEASLPRNWLCLRNDIVVLQLMTVIHISMTYFSSA